jgi:hypothetical protein
VRALQQFQALAVLLWDPQNLTEALAKLGTHSFGPVVYESIGDREE